jgi:hypothetical protein
LELSLQMKIQLSLHDHETIYITEPPEDPLLEAPPVEPQACLFLIVRLSILLTHLTLVDPVTISLQDPVMEVHPGELQLCLFLNRRHNIRDSDQFAAIDNAPHLM